MSTTRAALENRPAGEVEALVRGHCRNLQVEFTLSRYYRAHNSGPRKD